MVQKYRMVRMREDDYLALAALRDRVQAAQQRGHPALQGIDPDMTLSHLIRRLVRHVENDGRRKRESARRVAARRRAGRA